MQNDYFQEEVLCRNACLQEDEVSVESFLRQLLFNMKDNCSLVVIDESRYTKLIVSKIDFVNNVRIVLAEELLAGALILKIVRKIDFGRVFSRVMLVDGVAMKKCIKIKNHLSRKTDIFADFDCEMFLRYYAICIKPQYRKRGE